MTSKGLGSQKQTCWWSSSKHPESLRSIHITENNPCIHVSHKLLPQTTTPPPAPHHPTIFQLPPELCDTSRCSLSLDLRHMLPDSRIAAEGPHRLSFSASSFVSHCIASAQCLFCSHVSKVHYEIWLCGIFILKSYKRSALKCTLNCVFILSNDSLISLS